MKNDWKFYTTHEGINFIRNSFLDEKNYYRMKIFLKNYFKNRYVDNKKKQTSLLYSIVMSVSGERDRNVKDTQFLQDVMIDQRKISISWSETIGLSVTADSKEGNCIIRELYRVLKEHDDNEFWTILV